MRNLIIGSKNGFLSVSFPEPAIPWEGNGGSGIIRDRHTKNCMSPVLRMLQISLIPRASVSFPRDRRLGERDWDFHLTTSGSTFPCFQINWYLQEKGTLNY